MSISYSLVFSLQCLGAGSSFPSSRCPCAHSSAELVPLSPDAINSLDVNADTYGIGCKAHDQNRSVCTDPKKECLTLVPVPKGCTDDLTWCPLEWCYIQDPSNCSLNHELSQESGRFYSYATCGNRDRYTGDSQEYVLRGQVLQISYRQPSDGWKSSFNPQGNVIDDKWYGPTVDLMAAAADDGEFLLNTTDAPEDVLEKSGIKSKSGQCAYATGLGYLDVCASLIPMKDSYVSVSNFHSILTEDVYMVSPLFEKSIFIQIWGFLNPFDGWLWFAILAFVSFLSMCLVLQEWWEHPVYSAMGMSQLIIHAHYLGFCGFFSGGSMHDPESTGGKFINVGLALFFLLVISAYTANLAAYLVVSGEGPLFSSFQEVLDNGNRICGTGTTIAMMTVMYPSAVAHNMKKRALVLQGIDDGFCDVAVIYHEDLQHEHGKGKHCNMVIVGEPVLTVSKGFSIHPLKFHAISWYLQRQINSAKFAQILQYHLPTNQCSKHVSNDQGTFTVTDMLGAFVVSAALAIVGTVINLCSRRSQEAGDGGKQHGEDNVQSTNPPHVDGPKDCAETEMQQSDFTVPQTNEQIENLMKQMRDEHVAVMQGIQMMVARETEQQNQSGATGQLEKLLQQMQNEHRTEMQIVQSKKDEVGELKMLVEQMIAQTRGKEQNNQWGATEQIEKVLQQLQKEHLAVMQSLGSRNYEVGKRTTESQSDLSERTQEGSVQEGSVHVWQQRIKEHMGLKS